MDVPLQETKIIMILGQKGPDKRAPSKSARSKGSEDETFLVERARGQNDRGRKSPRTKCPVSRDLRAKGTCDFLTW